MATILERLRHALEPEYEVERELGRGGMGVVFLARDATLDRPVAVKIIRPEYATAEAAERFLREARLLASLSHPNVVSIHRAGERDGLFFYVMDRLEGVTVDERLARGPMSRGDVLKLGRDLLDALEAVHARGVIHRDIKPSNIFLIGRRAVLTDFGIAYPSGDRNRVTPGDTAPAGTPGYMPPEQAHGWDLTMRTDLYAVGMVLYEAYTRRKWAPIVPDDRADWSGVPRVVIPILERALAWHPDDRWPDAAVFRRELWHTRTIRYIQRGLAATAAGVVAGVALAYVLLGSRISEPGFADLALLPLEVRGTSDSLLGADLAGVAGVNLETFLDLVPQARVQSWWDTARARASAPHAPRELRARHVARGSVEMVGDSVIIRVSVTDSSGRVHPAGEVVRAASEPLTSLGYWLGFQIGRAVAPDRYMIEYRASRALAGKDNDAVREFLAGERAFHGNAWGVAAEHYRRAAELDTTFLLAWWRHHYSTYWATPGSPPVGRTLRRCTPSMVMRRGSSTGC